MALLDTLLAAAPAAATGVPPATPPDPATGLVATPPGIAVPAPYTIPAMTAPGGALDQAIKAGAATSVAGRKSVMSDPLVADYLAEKVKTDTASQQASQAYAANQARIAALNAQPDVPHVAVPRLHPLPVESEQPAYVAAAKANPLQTLGMFLPILAAFGGMKTANAANGALMAATGALKGAQEGNEAELAKAHQQWMDDTKTAIDSNTEAVSQYRMALDDRSATMADRMAKVSAIAAENKDILVQQALKSGHPENILHLLDMTEAAGNHLLPVVMEAQRAAAAEAERQDASARGWADVKVREYQAMIAQGKTTPNEEAGQLFAQISRSGYDSLSTVQKDALKRLQAYEVGLHPSPAAAVVQAMTGQQPADAASTAAAAASAMSGGATPAVPAAPAVPVTADTGAGAVATGLSAASPIVPASRAAAMALKPGTWFKDPAGNVIQKK